jgi:hypothetical protein
LEDLSLQNLIREQAAIHPDKIAIAGTEGKQGWSFADISRLLSPSPPNLQGKVAVVTGKLFIENEP